MKLNHVLSNEKSLNHVKQEKEMKTIDKIVRIKTITIEICHVESKKMKSMVATA